MTTDNWPADLLPDAATRGLRIESFDVFLSYPHGTDTGNRADWRAWIERLHALLVARLSQRLGRPMRVFLDLSDIASMDDWHHRIHRGLRTSAVMVAVVSPAYFRSPYCQHEWQTYVGHERAMGLTGPGGIAVVYADADSEFQANPPADPMRAARQRYNAF